MKVRYSTPYAPAETSISVVPFAGDASAWNAFVGRMPDATFCHLAEWREIMTDVLGHECLYRVAVDGRGKWLGILPLVRVRSRIFGHHLLSMPFLNYGGPLGFSRAQRSLVRSAIADARSWNADDVEIRARHLVGGEPEPAHAKITVLLDLPRDPQILWKERFRSKLRSQIRRPMKEDMEVRFGHDQLEGFYEVFCARMRDLGTPVLPCAFFEQMARTFREQVVIGTVHHQGRVVAAGFGFKWRKEFEITWAASAAEYDRLSPNMLLYWSFMEHLIGEGIETFNFGRCTPGESTHRFKRQWGGEDVPLPWLHWSENGKSETSRPDGPAVRAAVALWRRMPLFMANRAGPVLARGLPF